MRQAGVIRVDTVTELVDAGLLLATQPLPGGPRVAILGNSESLGLLTYDACLTEGLRPLPPRDLTTAAAPDDFRAALTDALADPACDAVVVTAIPRVGESGTTNPEEGGPLAAALRAAAAGGPVKPVVVVHVEIDGLAEALSAALTAAANTAPTGPGGAPTADHAAAPGGSAAALPDSLHGVRRIPAYPAAERAVRALGEAVGYATWRREAARAREGARPTTTSTNRAPPHSSSGCSGRTAIPDGVPSPPPTLSELLAHYGIRVRLALPAPDPDEAAEAAAASATPSRSRRPRPTCVTAPTSAAYASTSATRPSCDWRTAS